MSTKPRSKRPKAQPEAAPPLEVEEQSTPVLYSDEITFPSWDHRALPDPIEMYNFGLSMMGILAAASPDLAIRAQAARFFCEEFRPAKAGMTAREQLVVELRAELARDGAGEPLELETAREGAVPPAKDPAKE
jgi:hypothetical protein